MKDPIERLLSDPPDLPVQAGLAGLCAAVESRGTAVVQAPPGTGKTTLVPPALASHFPGRIVVTQPRRIAARAAARRLAHLLGEPIGRTVGFTVRGESQVGPDTRIEMVTTGILLRRLQRDPELAGVSVVVLDECHERHLDADLLLALLLDVRSNLRDDLRLVAMSATIEAQRMAELLGAGDGEGETGGRAPVVRVDAELFPISMKWTPARAARTDSRGVTQGFLDHVAATVRRALAEHEGDVLVFLPGVGEVMGVTRRLTGLDADIRPLHGRLPSREQDLALVSGSRRRVVVATAVAESSLTVPGVRIVVDAGLSREPRMDLRRGLPGLVTVPVSRANAEQRAGRAGRQGPGAVFRCWAEHEHGRLPEHPTPEIHTADLTSFALELAAWGSPDGAGLALLDAPPVPAMTVATETLRGLGAIDEDGRITARGRRIVNVAADPRLARALLDAAPVVGPRLAAEVVALLSEDIRAPDGDLVAALRSVRRQGRAAGAWTGQVTRLEGAVDRAGKRGTSRGSGARNGSSTRQESEQRDRPLSQDLAVGLVVALAHPERIAKRRTAGGTYLMVAGTGAELPQGSALTGYDWLAIADVDRQAGRRDARIRSAAPIDEDLALEAAGAWLTEEENVQWISGRVEANRSTLLGAIELTRERVAKPDPERIADAIRRALSRDGLEILPWREGAKDFRARLAFLNRTLGDPWPDVSNEALMEGLETWLGPDLGRVRGDVSRIDVLDALRRLLPWPEAGRLDELAPERITVPSGSNIRVDYSGEQPVLAVRVQEAFGWETTPRIVDGRVPVLLHLLSPARRPAAVTADLESFWRVGYPQVRADLRGKYPKHAWPEDPWSVPPSAGRPRRGR